LFSEAIRLTVSALGTPEGLRYKQDRWKEHAQDRPKEQDQDRPKEHAQDRPKEHAQDHPKEHAAVAQPFKAASIPIPR
jgi:hypothetical protein